MNNFIGDDTNIFAEKMLENGFFPENLPPVFRVENLHEAALTALGDDKFLTSKKPTEPCKYNASKRNGQRRNFSMPNPVFAVDCAKYFLKYSEQIGEHFSVSNSSCSVPRFSMEGRAQRIDSFSDFYHKRRRSFSTSRYIVKTDVSRFFHSIYTHCLPWALHEKKESKKDRKVESEEIFGNRLDNIIRQSQDGQTVGIPVGPDCSRLISEIVGVSIDARFKAVVGEEVPLLRLVDDIFIGADNLDDANGYLSAIREAIRYFELDINESKTFILEASKDVELYWPVELRREIERFTGRGAADRADFIHMLDNIIAISNSRNDDGIVKYAIRKIDDLMVWNHYWNELEPFLIRCCISFPHSWDYAAQVVAWRHLTSGVDKAKWKIVIDKSIRQNLKSGHDSEITWALWLATQLKIEVANDIFNGVFEKCGPFPMMMAIDVFVNHNTSGLVLPKNLILEKLGDTPLLRENWLVAFEADRLGALNIKTKNQQGYEFFKTLYDDTVSFYDSEASLFSDEDDLFETNAIKKTSSYEEIEDVEDEDEEDDIEF